MEHAATPAPSTRLVSIDLLRGAVMIVMLLDHVRDFVHRDGLTVDPTDPGTTHAALFFTRWITHFCAPVFVFLAGTSGSLMLARGMSRRALAGFLLRRGLFLVAFELVVLRPLIWFNLDYSFVAHLQVIWAIGWSMVALCALLWLPNVGIGVLGLALIAGHNAWGHANFTFAQFPSWAALEVIAHHKGAIRIGEGGPIAFVQYPLIPWVGVMLCGFWLGALYRCDPAVRRRTLLALGIGASVLFLVLRGVNGYGDPGPWTSQATLAQTVFSFLRVEKYPPSLLFLLMTLGPALLALAALDGWRDAGRGRLVVVLGRVPLFFYVLQWPAAHLASRLFQLIDGQPIGWDSPNPITLGNALPPGCGFSLPVVYLAWALCLAALTPLCVAYARFKRAHPQWRILSYL